MKLNRRNWRLNLGRWTLAALLLSQFPPPPPLLAQNSPHFAPGQLLQLQVQEQPVDVSSQVGATASFDPPVARVGDKVFYRVAIDATESSILWPDRVATPPQLKLGAKTHGQLVEMRGNQYHPMTVFLYEVRPAAAGNFTIPGFVVNAYDRPVKIPPANLSVLPEDTAPPSAPRELVVEVSPTNLFAGQPVPLRVLLPATAANQIEALREIQINGDGFITDKTRVRQAIQPVNIGGQTRPAFIYETTLTPMATGSLQVSAQGFTAGSEFSAPISINGPVSLPGGPPSYVFLVSDPVTLNVRPLPAEGEPPGFTGSIGKFTADPPRLSTNRIQVGQPVTLNFSFHSQGDFTRFIPPEAPLSRDWQIIPNDPPENGFTLIPLTDEPRATPPIPFAAFDPASGKYLDLAIPALPVTVVGESLPVEMDQAGESSSPSKLSGLAPGPGRTAPDLTPPQLRGWLVGAQFLPVIGLLALWQWDRRRRFLEAHPEIVRRRRARRELRREKRRLQKAATGGDPAAFAQHAANAMRIACAPRLAAHPQALVGADVLAQLGASDRDPQAIETARAIFAAADAQFAAAPPAGPDWPAPPERVDAVLLKLEEDL